MIDELPENRIPLYLVGEWIATEGGTRDLGPSMVAVKRAGHPTTFDYSEAHAHAWDTALEKLKVEILAGRLPVEGQRGGDKGKPFEIISPQEFGDEFCNPFRDTPLETIFSERRCVGFDPDNCGAIRNRWEVYWSNICARSRDDVLKLWPAPSKSALSIYSDDDIRELLRVEIAARGGFVSQNGGAEIVRAKYPGFPRDRVRPIVKGLTGNSKQGPRGRRKKCAE
jgi:hypothetical protein